MIKQIIASTMLTASIGIQNTTITQSTTRKVYLDNESTWTYVQNYNPNTTILTGINGYKDIKSNQTINTSAFETKQRKLELYSVQNNVGIGGNTLYIMQEIKGIADIEFNYIHATINGFIQNQFAVSDVSYTLYIEQTSEIQDTYLINFLDNQIYSTYNDYQTIRNHLNTFVNQGQTQTLNPQNYTNVLANTLINIIPADNYACYCIRIDLIYQQDTIENLPLELPYSPFYNYGRELTDEFKWETTTDGQPTGEIVDIPGIMFTMLGMPFAFVAQAFDLTIFPGTAYAVNLSHIFLAIAGAGILLFVIKKVIK